MTDGVYGARSAPTSPWAKAFIGQDAPKSTREALQQHSFYKIPVVACTEFEDDAGRVRRPAIAGKDKGTSDFEVLQDWFSEGDYIPGLDWRQKGWLPLDIPAECGEVPEELRDTLTIGTPSGGWIVLFDVGVGVEYDCDIYDTERGITVPETHIILPHDPSAGWSFVNPRKPSTKLPESVKRALTIRFPKRKPEAPKPHLILLQGSKTKALPINWMWRGWLARGMFHILGGHGGTGKSTLAEATIAAVITAGGTWPDGTRCTEPGDVLIWSSEDSWENTILPRFLAAGGDPARLWNVGNVALDAEGKSRQFDPSTDLPLLEDALQALPNPMLFILDPVIVWSARKAGDTAMIRADMAPLVYLLDKNQVAGLGITHFSKGTAEMPLAERFTGSHAWTALARLCHATVTNEETGRSRLIRQAKGNVFGKGGGFDYEIEELTLPENPEIETSRVVWGETCDPRSSAQQLYDDIAGTSGGYQSKGTQTKQDRAEEIILRGIPNVGDTIASNQLYDLAEQEGISAETVKNARERLTKQGIVRCVKNRDRSSSVTRLRATTLGDKARRPQGKAA